MVCGTCKTVDIQALEYITFESTISLVLMFCVGVGIGVIGYHLEHVHAR